MPSPSIHSSSSSTSSSFSKSDNDSSLFSLSPAASTSSSSYESFKSSFDLSQQKERLSTLRKGASPSYISFPAFIESTTTVATTLVTPSRPSPATLSSNAIPLEPKFNPSFRRLPSLASCFFSGVSPSRAVNQIRRSLTKEAEWDRTIDYDSMAGLIKREEYLCMMRERALAAEAERIAREERERDTAAYRLLGEMMTRPWEGKVYREEC